MRLFLDTSVLLAASGSDKGASRFIVNEAKKRQWVLCSSHYCREETRRNLPKLGPDAGIFFEQKLLRRVEWVTDSLVTDWPVVFAKAKDKPVLLTALAVKSDAILTLDREDFHGRLGTQFYGMAVQTPGDWLLAMREAEGI